MFPTTMTRSPIFRCVPLLLLAWIASPVKAVALLSMPPKAPTRNWPVVTEAGWGLTSANLVYSFGHIVELFRNKEIDLKLPKDFPLKDIDRFKDESFDLREYNNGNGLSFAQLYSVLQMNIDAIRQNPRTRDKFDGQVVEDLRSFFETKEGKGAEKDIFLSTYRSVQSDISCVYGVIKDKRNKMITISFRGSMMPFENRDWRSNFNARLVGLPTPARIKDKMKGELRERILVHRGFFNYLFNNPHLDGMQRYDRIIEDIRPLVEDGYGVHVTGHSLGGALAHVFSLALAGAGEEADFVPRPISTVTYAAPISGSGGYRKAYEQLELDGLVRVLRVVNSEDAVPTIPFVSFGFRKRSFKHVGINLRLKRGGIFLQHSSRANLSTAIGNSILVKPFQMTSSWAGPFTAHSLTLSHKRLVKNAEALSVVTLDGLLKDENVVSPDFLSGKTCSAEEEE